MDAVKAYRDGNPRKALEHMAPKAVKDVMAAEHMARTGYATDTKGRKNMDVTLADAAVKAVGFNPTRLAQASRARGPVMQDAALHKNEESSIVDMYARSIAFKDKKLEDEATKRLNDWNATNPKNFIKISPEQKRSAAQQYMRNQDTRIIKSMPREIRGRAGLDLAK
jgi:hypothetical protein